LKDAGEVSGEQISLAKYANVEMAQETARTSRELLGGVGILDSFCAFRHMVNLESVATYEGTRDIHRLVLGRWLTGIQAFR
jgi:glutaryl-CoA dehydrogenase